MRHLVVTATARNGRESIHPARHIKELLGEEAELFDIAEKDIPMMQARRYKEEGEVPQDVEEFGRKVEEAETLVIVTPEYNHSIPGPLKNLLDYLYPEYEDMVFAYVTVSSGGFGGVRCMSHLHDITLAFNATPGPSLQVSNVTEIFEDGELIDNGYRQQFKDFAEKIMEQD